MRTNIREDIVTEIFLVRHGQTVSNVQGRIQGHSDSPLSEQGKKEVERLASRLKDLTFSALWSSDLGRAMATSEILAKSLDLPIQPQLKLREVSFGEVEGMTWEEVRDLHGKLNEAWYQHHADVRMPGGESREEVTYRVVGLLESWAVEHAGQRILAVTHGGVLACIFSWLLQIPRGVRPLCAVDNAAISILQHKNERWKIKTWNDGWHLFDLKSNS